MLCQGAVLGAVVADTRELALEAARLVKVTYEDLQPVLLTIEVCRPRRDILCVLTSALC